MDVGSTLKQARIARGQYIPEVAHAAKLPATVVKAIEANDFTLSGSPEQVRAHVTAVATALGLDPEPLADEAAPRRAPGANDLDVPTLAEVPAERLAADAAGRPGWLLPTILVGAAAVAAIAVWAGRGETAAPTSTTSPSASAEPTASVEPTPSATTPSEAPSTAEPEPSASPTETPSTAEPSASTAEPTQTATPEPSAVPSVLPARVEAPLTLVIEARSATSVRVSNAQGTLFRGTLAAGQSRTFTSRSDTTVRVDDAAAVLVTLNGQAYDGLGEAGEVLVHTVAVG